MTPFTKKANPTYGDILSPAMEITDTADAQQYLEQYIKYIEGKGGPENGMTARELALHNIGYYTGYYNRETQERVLKLFNTAHPVFGSCPESITPQQAFEMGKKFGSNDSL